MIESITKILCFAIAGYLVGDTFRRKDWLYFLLYTFHAVLFLIGVCFLGW